VKLYVKELAASLPSEVLSVCQTIQDNGFQAWLVGGCLRDFFRQNTYSDIDLATNALPAEIQAIFDNTVDIGSKYGTILIKIGLQKFEVTTLRQESTYTDSRRPDSVIFCNDLSLDLARRDFTINSLAFEPLKKELIDLYGGLDDLQSRLLRTVGDPVKRFSEDGLRIMRACRFVAQLNFELEDQTYMAMQQELNTLELISVERLANEFDKLLKAPFVNEGLLIMKDTGVLDLLFPEFADLPDELWSKLVLFLNQAEPELRWLILADFCQRLVGFSALSDWLAKWQLSRVELDQIIRVLKKADFCYDRQMSDSALRIFIREVGLDILPQWLKFYKRKALNETQHSEAFLLRMQKRFEELALDTFNIDSLAISGDDLLKLGVPQGPKIGQVLNKLLDIVTEYPSKNTWSQLIGYVKNLCIT